MSVSDAKSKVDSVRININNMLRDKSLTKEQRMSLYNILGELSALESTLYICDIKHRNLVTTLPKYVM